MMIRWGGERGRKKGGKVEGEEGEEIERKTTSLKVDPELWRKTKKVAIDRHMKLYELVEIALRREIKNGGKED